MFHSTVDCSGGDATWNSPRLTFGDLIGMESSQGSMTFSDWHGWLKVGPWSEDSLQVLQWQVRRQPSCKVKFYLRPYLVCRPRFKAPRQVPDLHVISSLLSLKRIMRRTMAIMTDLMSRMIRQTRHLLPKIVG